MNQYTLKNNDIIWYLYSTPIHLNCDEMGKRYFFSPKDKDHKEREWTRERLPQGYDVRVNPKNQVMPYLKKK